MNPLLYKILKTMKDNSSTTQGNIVPKTKTEIKVEFNPLRDKIDYDKEYFTEIDRWYSDKEPVAPDYGVKRYLSVNEVIELLNSLDGDYAKDGTPALLKGKYLNGTGGEFCIEGADFLPFDIDVKNKEGENGKLTKENPHLFDAKLNSDVFDFMQSISLFTARSNSGYGIFGFLYVPGLGKYLNGQKTEHKIVGDRIVSELSRKIFNDIGIEVKFDSKQNTFRQIRNTSVQSSLIELNKNHLQVDFTVTKTEEITITGIPQYTSTSTSGYKGTIRYQFNQQNRIEDALEYAGFKKVRDRYLHPSTTSDSTGQVNTDDNNFYSHSESYGVGLYTPFDLYAQANNLTKREFTEYLKKEGYKHIPLKKSVIDEAVERLNNEQLGTEDIFEICNPLRSLSVDQRYDIIDELNVDSLTSMYVHHYMQIPELSIKFNSEMKIGYYLSDDFDKVASIIENNKKTCVYAGTGYGKTKAFVDYFKNKVGCKTIFLVPLQVLANQVAAKYKIPCLIGESTPQMHSLAKRLNIFVATYEQGVKHIATGQFDYIVIDEFHNMITANSYKEEALSNLSQKLEHVDSKIIGLTGTPSTIMRRLGFHMLRVTRNKPETMFVNERFTNRRGHFIVINHILEFGGKSIFRLNSTNDLQSIKEELIHNYGYKEDAVLVLYSSKSIKNSEAYKLLVDKERFADEVKIVLTTAMIDEGLNIKQTDFENIVYVESNDYFPRPEPIKQFFARVRNPGPKTKYFLYRKHSSKAERVYFNEDDYFIAAEKTLKEDRNDMEDYNTYMDIFNNNDFYYNSTGEVNLPNLAYYTTQTAYSNYTTSMFDRQLKNYNIEVIRDDKFKEKPIDSSFKKTWDIEAKAATRYVWVNERETVYSVIQYESQSPKLRIELEHKGYDWNDEYIEFIYQNIKEFEKYFTYQIRFVRLGLDPDQYIVGPKKLASIEALNNELFFLESMATINTPKTNADYRSKERLEDVRDTLLNKVAFTKQDIDEVFSKYPLIKKPSLQTVKRFLEQYAVVTYNKQTKTYRVKARN